MTVVVACRSGGCGRRLVGPGGVAIPLGGDAFLGDVGYRSVRGGCWGLLVRGCPGPAVPEGGGPGSLVEFGVVDEGAADEGPEVEQVVAVSGAAEEEVGDLIDAHVPGAGGVGDAGDAGDAEDPVLDVPCALEVDSLGEVGEVMGGACGASRPGVVPPGWGTAP